MSRSLVEVLWPPDRWDQHLSGNVERLHWIGPTKSEISASHLQAHSCA